MIKTLIQKCLKNTRLIRGRYLKFLYNYDKARYEKHSGMNEDNQEFTATKMRLLVHTIEKALSLKNIRSGFGKEKISKLIELYYQYNSYPVKKDEQVLELTKSIISKYSEFQMGKMDLSFIPEEFKTSAQLNVGSFYISKEDYCKENGFLKTAFNRHSIRDFSDKKIDRQDIIKAIELAQTAPSACNRQPIRVYICDNNEKCETIKKMHGGLNGFSNIAAIIAVTGDLTLYQGEYERNTVFVDGGIFLMNLLYSLQYYNIANCPIIWGAEPDNDNKLYELLNVPKNEEIISLVAVGYFPDEGAKAACSYKRATEDIMSFI